MRDMPGKPVLGTFFYFVPALLYITAEPWKEFLLAQDLTNYINGCDITGFFLIFTANVFSQPGGRP